MVFSSNFQSFAYAIHLLSQSARREHDAWIVESKLVSLNYFYSSSQVTGFSKKAEFFPKVLAVESKSLVKTLSRGKRDIWKYFLVQNRPVTVSETRV